MICISSYYYYYLQVTCLHGSYQLNREQHLTHIWYIWNEIMHSNWYIYVEGVYRSWSSWEPKLMKCLIYFMRESSILRSNQNSWYLDRYREEINQWIYIYHLSSSFFRGCLNQNTRLWEIDLCNTYWKQTNYVFK